MHSVTKNFRRLVLTEHLPEGVWTMNFDKYNSEDDIVISELFAKTLLNIRNEVVPKCPYCGSENVLEPTDKYPVWTCDPCGKDFDWKMPDMYKEPSNDHTD